MNIYSYWLSVDLGTRKVLNVDGPVYGNCVYNATVILTRKTRKIENPQLALHQPKKAQPNAKKGRKIKEMGIFWMTEKPFWWIVLTEGGRWTVERVWKEFNEVL